MADEDAGPMAFGSQPKSRALRLASRVFDRFEALWEHPTARRLLARTLIAVFLGSLLAIELARQGVWTEVLGHRIPANHFWAISGVVSLLLVVEVVDLIVGLAASVARTVGMQLEIFSLVLLRKSFDELTDFPEPITAEGHLTALLHMGSQSVGALVVFLILGGYYRIQRHIPVSDDAGAVADFVATKKALCLLLLGAFASTGLISASQSLIQPLETSVLSLRFFEIFFTILIFADVLIVLASLGASRLYEVVFRNFAFAFVTVLLRIALAAEPIANALIGVGAAVYALAVSALVWVFGRREAHSSGAFGSANPSQGTGGRG